MLANYEGSPVVITKFNASAVLDGKSLKKATLKFYSKCTISGKNSNVQIAHIGTGWDATTATWTNTNKAEILNAVGINGNGVNVKTSKIELTQDVTELLAASTDNTIGFAVYTYTGREQEISDITLTIEAIDASASSTYTVKYVDESGNELKESEVRSESIGATINITDGDKASIYNADKTKKYIYLSDDAQGKTVAGDASTVITVTFREAAIWNYTVTAVDANDNILKVLKTGQNFEAETFNLGYAALINIDGTIWKSDKLSSDKKGYYLSMNLDADNKNQNIKFTASEITNIVYCSEGEDIEGLLLATNGNTSIRSSNGASAYAPEDTEFTKLPNGKYKLTTVICDVSKNAGSVWNFFAGTENIFQFTAGSVNWAEGTSEEFTLNAPETPILLGKGGGNNAAVDLIYIQKTGDAEVIIPEPSYAVGKMDFNAMDIPTSNSGNAGDITEDKTFNVEGEFSVTISPKTSGNTQNRFWNTAAGPQLRIYNGTITINAATGKKINKIVFAKGDKWGAITPNNGEMNGQTWTGDAETIVFTVGGQCQINSITVGEAPKAPLAEAANIAAFKALEKGTDAKLALNGAKVTFVNGDNTFIEDETGALLLYKTGLTLTAGKALTGNIIGQYKDYNGMPELIGTEQTPASEYTEADAAIVSTVATVADAQADAFTGKLVKFENVAIDADLQTIKQGEAEIAFYDKFKVMPADYVYPANAASIVGIIYVNGEHYTFHPVSADSIKAATAVTVPEAADIAAFKALENGTEAKLLLNGTKVTFVKDDVAFIEDESGAIRMSAIGLDLTAGTALNGYIYGKIQSTMSQMMVASDNTASSEFTATATTIIPKDVYVEELADNAGRMVALSNVSINLDYQEIVQIVDGVDSYASISDEFGVLPEGFVMPAKIERIVVIADGMRGFGRAYPVSADSIKAAEFVAPVEAKDIADAKTYSEGTELTLVLNKAVVKVARYANSSSGRKTVIEDNSGAIDLDGEIYSMLLEAEVSEGKAITGKLIGQFTRVNGVPTFALSEQTGYSTIDAVEDAVVTATEMTVAEAKNIDNVSKFINLKNLTNVKPAETEGWLVTLTAEQNGEAITIEDLLLTNSYGSIFEQFVDGEGNLVLPSDAIESMNGILSVDANGGYVVYPTEITFATAPKGPEYKTFDKTTVMTMSAENIANAVAEKWAEGGESRTDNKKGNIDPETDEEISATVMEGIGLKKGNAAKAFKVYVTGIDKLSAYGVSTNKNERSIVVTATPEDGEAVTASTPSVDGKTAVATVELDKTKKYAVEFTGIDVDGNGADVALHAVKFIVEKEVVETVRTWDFTKWSEETVENLKADAATVVPGEDGTYPTVTPWRSYEKVGGPSDADPDRNGAAYWYGTEIAEAQELTANGKVIAETKGLLFNKVAAGALAIAIDYPSTTLGNYNGPAYLWIGGKNHTFVIPAVKPGSAIIMEVESHKNNDKRGVKLSINGTDFAEGIPATFEKFTWTVPGEETDEPVDVTVTNTNGCHIYTIVVDEDGTGITNMNTVKVENNNVYTINGVMVRKAGESLDGLAKGLYIIGGKKVVIR